MILRQLGLGVQELEAGPITILLSHSIPVAYRDIRPDAMPPGLYRTDMWFSKATTLHLNKWLHGKRYATLPHDLIVSAFQGISRYGQNARQRETEAGHSVD